MKRRANLASNDGIRRLAVIFQNCVAKLLASDRCTYFMDKNQVPRRLVSDPMKTFCLGVTLVFLLASEAPLLQKANAQGNSAKELVGLWQAKRRFDSDVRETLVMRQIGNEWQAQIAGRAALVTFTARIVDFELPNAQGSFKGKLDSTRTKIVGHWIQPATMESGVRYASPLTLSRDKADVWRGQVSPLNDTMTLYLMVKQRDDGSLGVLLRNPERNLGKFVRVDHIERDGDTVRFVAGNSGSEKGQRLAEGRYFRGDDTLSIYFPSAGGTFDFKRAAANEPSDFYPRGFPTVNYSYALPVTIDDGWPTASLEDVGISRAGIEKFIQMIIDTPIESVGSQEMHGVLIARHGKLVLEEYFHGEYREKPHDTRSASKSLTATLFGAAINAGVPVTVSTPVYEVMNRGTLPADLEPRKRALKVEHLLTMSSGLDCDDGDPKSPGNEDTMQEQHEEPDYYKFTMALKMVRDPGERAVYASAQPNLIGGVLQRASQQSLPMLFHKLIAEPLGIKRYYMNLAPTGDAYMGGGVRFLPRDFMKLAQLHLNGGSWNGRRVLTKAWCQRATSDVVRIDNTTAFNWQTNQMERGKRKYGYLWWIEDYPFKGRTVRAFFAGGNGGQIVMGIPDLDLVIAFYGGNYNDRASLVPQWVYVSQYILPAVDD
jgi:CubicO group peptidase (beta-lactamase class C family)